jgi:type VI secretion system protein ImpE
MTDTAPRPDQAGNLFHAGHLKDAIAASTAAVKRNPSDLGARVLLAELLAFAGNAERADVILDAASDIDPGAAITVAEFRQLLRAEVARRQLFRDGRVPEFIGEPSTWQRTALAALVALREGNAAEAARLSAEAEACRVVVNGRHGEHPFQDLRDADDLLAGTIEVLTTTGKYFWIPVERVRSIDFHPPKRPRDLLWRRATMSVADGPDGDVYIPATYATLDQAADDSLLLGRSTDWTGPEGGPVRGLGLRVFLVGDDAVTIMEMSSIEIGQDG